MAGASAACNLAQDGRVTVLEREHVAGYHTTGRSAAVFAETYGNPQIRTLTRASRAFYETPPDGFTETPLLSPRRVMFIGRADQQPPAPDPHHPVELLDEARCRELMPALREGYAAWGTLDEDEADIDVAALHQGYLKTLARNGGRLVTKAGVTAIARRDGLWRVTTAAGDFAAPVLVNAAGAWADEIAGLAGVAQIGLTPKRRTALIFDPGLGAIAGWPLVVDADEEFYFRPEAGSKVFASPADATPSPPCDAQPEELDVALCVDRIQRATTFEIARIEHKWAGLRSFVADGGLVIGFAPDADGFFWCAAQGGYGIQTAPAAAICAAALARGEALPDAMTEHGLTPELIGPARLF
jgi:D-arginine dehydrogenase